MSETLSDVGAERTVLGAVLVEPDLLVNVEGIVRPEHFAGAQHRKVFSAMLTMNQAGRGIDLVTLAAELKGSGDLEQVGGGAYLAGLVDGLPRLSNVDTWARIVRDKARRRALVVLAERAIEAARASDIGTDQLVDGLQANLGRLVESGERRTVKLGDVLGPAMAELDRFAAAKDAVTGVPSGLIDVDRLLGGWKDGALYVIAARPARGKSAFCAQAAVHAATTQGTKSLVFSMEMAPYQLAARMLLADAEVDRWDLRKESAHADYAWIKIHQAHKKLADLPIWFDQRESPDLAQIRSSVKQQKAGPGVDLVIVDYLQRCTVDPKLDRWLAVGDLARGLKSLARTVNVPVIAACQLNAEAEDKRPTMAMLGQAQSIIGAEADVIGLLHPNDLKAWQTQEYPQIDLLIDKNRHGPTMSIELSFERRCTRFVSIAKNGGR